MLRLEDIKPGALIQGLEPGEVVRIVTSAPIGPNALTVYYKKNDGPSAMFRRGSDESTY